jgi:hypothetical protein
MRKKAVLFVCGWSGLFGSSGFSGKSGSTKYTRQTKQTRAIGSASYPKPVILGDIPSAKGREPCVAGHHDFFAGFPST